MIRRLVLALALLFAAPAAALADEPATCGTVISYPGGLWVEVYDTPTSWMTFDAIRLRWRPGLGIVQLTLDGNTRTELAEGHYEAVWHTADDVSTPQPFDVVCTQIGPVATGTNPVLPETSTATNVEWPANLIVGVVGLVAYLGAAIAIGRRLRS